MIDLNNHISLFYLLEEMHALTGEKMQINHRLDAYKADLALFRDEFNTELTAIFKDYLTVTCIGEARHGNCCKPEFKMMLNPKKALFGRDKLRRDIAYEKLIKLSPQINPRLTLSWIYVLFSSRIWSGAFGGKKWAEIVKTALLEYDTPKEIFIDTVINLQHNSGSCLNKNWEFFTLKTERLSNFLNNRAQTSFSFFTHMNDETLYHVWYPYLIPQRLWTLLERGWGMGILPEPALNCFIYDRVLELPKYSPLQWGEGILTSENLKNVQR